MKDMILVTTLLFVLIFAGKNLFHAQPQHARNCAKIRTEYLNIKDRAQKLSTRKLSNRDVSARICFSKDIFHPISFFICFVLAAREFSTLKVRENKSSIDWHEDEKRVKNQALWKLNQADGVVGGVVVFNITTEVCCTPSVLECDPNTVKISRIKTYLFSVTDTWKSKTQQQSWYRVCGEIMQWNEVNTNFKPLGYLFFLTQQKMFQGQVTMDCYREYEQYTTG